MTAQILGINLNLKLVNLMNNEHLKPEFVKLNPQHTVPTLVDDGFVCWESRAIIQYLCNKYNPKSSLYSQDPQKRAIVERFLYFDVGVLYPALSGYLYPQMLHGQAADAEKEKAYREKVELLQTLLGDSKYLAGDNLTLADISIYSSLSMMSVLDYDYSVFPKLSEWLTRVKGSIMDDEAINVKSLLPFKEMLKSKTN